MSWVEIMKVNSDLDEPLNFTNYIYDISVFGPKSYVMAPMNRKLWESLSLRSMYLYGHTGIRDYVYDYLSEEDIDALFHTSGICGKQLNAFHDFEGCDSGDGLSVVRHMTQAAYNTLKDKFQKGYNRFAESFLSKESGVGQWINKTFGLDNTVLVGLQSIGEIVSNEEAMNTILGSEAAAVAVTHSSAAMNAVAQSEEAFAFITKRMTEVSLSDVAVNAMFPNASLMENVVADTAVMTALSDSDTAMYAIIRSEIAMDKIINSPGAMEVIANNENAMGIIVQAIEEIASGSNAMTTIRNNINTINSNLPNLIEGNSARDTMTATSEQITTALHVLHPILNTITVIDKVTRAMADNESAMEAIAASTVAMTAICNSPAALDIVLASTTAMTEIVSNTIAMNAILTNSTVRTKFADSSTAVNALIANTEVFNTYLTGENMYGALISSQTAMDIIAGSSSAMTRVMYYANSTTKFFNGSYSVGKGLNTYGNIGNSTLASRNTFADVCGNETAISAATGNTTVWSKIYKNSSAITTLANSTYASYAANTEAKVKNILSTPTAYTVILNSANAMNRIVGNSGFYSTAFSYSTYMDPICGYAVAINCILKNATARTYFAKSNYLQDNYGKLESTCSNAPYFYKSVTKTNSSLSSSTSSSSSSRCGFINYDNNAAVQYQNYYPPTAQPDIVFVNRGRRGSSLDSYTGTAYHTASPDTHLSYPASLNYVTNKLYIGGLYGYGGDYLQLDYYVVRAK